MTNLLSAFGDLFTFLIDALGDIANFFTTNTLGILILGIAFFSVAFQFIAYIIDKFKK